jgi:hypothetical protein
VLTVRATCTLVADPERRTSASGREWLQLKVLVPAGNETMFVVAAVFDAELIGRLSG